MSKVLSPIKDEITVVEKIEEESTKMGFFDTVLSPPDWLNQDYLEGVLRKYENDTELKVIVINLIN